MTEPNDVPKTIVVPGSMERLPNYTSSFMAPIHTMLADRSIRQHGPRLFEVVSEEAVTIQDSQGRVEQVLTKGTFFVSMTWDFDQAWHQCYIDWSIKR